MRRVKRKSNRLLKFAAAAVLACVLYVLWLPDVAPLKHSNPRTTAFIELRRAADRRAGRDFSPRMVWVPWDRISDNLFLVATKNLGEQAEQEFMAYVPNDDNRKFTELYSLSFFMRTLSEIFECLENSNCKLAIFLLFFHM